MDQRERVAEILMSGIVPMELLVRDVYASRGSKPIALRCAVRINSLEFGALEPAQYRVAVSRVGLDARLARWTLERVYYLLVDGSGKDDEWVVEVPVSMLLSGELMGTLRQWSERGIVLSGHLGIAVTAEILLVDKQEAIAALKELRALGVHLMLTEFGDESCPVMRFSGLPFDTVVLDRYLTSCIEGEDVATVNAVLSLLRGSGCRIVLDTAREDVLCRARRFAVDGYTSDAYRVIDEVSAP